MTTITVTVFPNAEEWILKNVPNLESDGVCAVRPRKRFNPDGLTPYEDIEESTKKNCTLQDHIDALQKLCEQIGTTLFVGGLKSPMDLVDPCNWDAEVTDAYWQLVYHGEVIYG